MRPSHAGSNGRRYRYYVSADLVETSVAAGATGWRIPAAEIEAAVARTLAARLRDPGFLSDALGHALGHAAAAPAASARLLACIAELADRLDAPGSAAGRETLRRLVTRVELSEAGLRAEARFPPPDATTDAATGPAVAPLPPFAVTAPLQLQSRGPELRLVLQGAAAPLPRPDPLLLRTLIAARSRVADWLDPAQALSVSAIARRDGVHVSDVSRSLPLAFLAPDLVEEILDGTQPPALTAERLKRVGDLPLSWDAQRALLG
jgi:hypothetical protein